MNLLIKNMKARGFTLIELLMVITIIGILSSVVLTSLNTGRNDTKVKSQLNSLRTAAEIYHNTNQNYGGAVAGTEGAVSPNFGNGCSANMFTDTLIDPSVASASYPVSTTMKCTSSGTAYAVSASLNSSNGATVDHWCIDSSGAAKAIGALHNNSTYVCP